MTVLRYTWHLSEASHVERVTDTSWRNAPEFAIQVAADEDLLLGHVVLAPVQTRARITVASPPGWAGEYEIEVAWRPMVAVKRAADNKEEPRHD